MPDTRRSSIRSWMGRATLVVAAMTWMGLAPASSPSDPPPHPAAQRPAAKPGQPVVADLNPGDSIPVPPARWPGFPMLPDGQFPIAAYGAPIAPQTTDFRYVEMKQSGINVTVKMLDDPGTVEANRQRIRLGARHKMWSFVLDNRTIVADRAYSPGWKLDVDNTVASYAGEPGVLGYFIADEPVPQHYASVAAMSRRLAKGDPAHPALVMFMGYPGKGIFYFNGMPYTSYLRRYLDQAHPGIFSVDSYPLHKGSDNPFYETTWDSVSYVSRETGTPFWACLLSSPFANFRVPNASEMTWQAFLPMAYGARGIIWFNYWTPAPTTSSHFHDGPITYDGRRTPMYGRLADVNARIQLLGQEMGGMQWQGVRHVATVPYGCRAFRPTQDLRIESKTPVAVGFFKQKSGANYGLFVNRDYKSVANVRILAPDTLLRWARASGPYRALNARPAGNSIQNDLLISPGDAELIRLPKSFDYLKTQ